MCWYSKNVFRNYLSFFLLALQSNAGYGLLIHEVSRSHTTTHNSRWDSSGRVIMSSQRPLLDNNTQHSQETDIHVHGGIRTHNLSRREALDHASTGICSSKLYVLHYCKVLYPCQK